MDKRAIKWFNIDDDKELFSLMFGKFILTGKKEGNPRNEKLKHNTYAKTLAYVNKVHRRTWHRVYEQINNAPDPIDTKSTVALRIASCKPMFVGFEPDYKYRCKSSIFCPWCRFNILKDVIKKKYVGKVFLTEKITELDFWSNVEEIRDEHVAWKKKCVRRIENYTAGKTYVSISKPMNNTFSVGIKTGIITEEVINDTSVELKYTHAFHKVFGISKSLFYNPEMLIPYLDFKMHML